MKVAIGIYGIDSWFPGDFSGVIDVIRLADEKGIDQLHVTDHVVMGENLDQYPYGPFPGNPDSPWYEPIAVLAAAATATRRIRLGTGILIGPLRSSVLLAKQLATLDYISKGRVNLGLGIGWQQEEYLASGIPWEERYLRLDEQIEVCRQLWRAAPASFEGQTVKYDRIYSRPAPVQANGVPIWLGIAPTDKNIARIAATADGWMPMEQDVEKLKAPIAKIRSALDSRGRDPASFDIRVVLKTQLDSNNRPDLEKAMATIPALRDIGATMIEFRPKTFCKSPDELEVFFERIAAIKGD